MVKDLNSLLKTGDLVNVLLQKPLTPQCLGSETSMSNPSRASKVITGAVIGTYAGSRPGIIKINPLDERLLDCPSGISRYVVIAETHISEVYRYAQPEKIFP